MFARASKLLTTRPFNFLFKASVYTTLGLGAATTLLYVFQEKLLYFPQIPNRTPNTNAEGFRHPGEHNLNYEDLHIMTPDGLKLHGWFIKTQNPKTSPTIVHFQGRAGNIGHRIPFLAMLNRYCDANVLIVGYRGYSYSEGKPNEEGLQIDSCAIIDYIFSRDDIDKNKIFLMGSSMGGAVTVYGVTRTNYKVAGVILENTFTSISDMVDVKFPIFSGIKQYILKMHWKSIESISHIKAPIMFIYGLKDKLIPAKQMQQLYDAANGSLFKERLDIEEGTHNETWKIGEAKYFAGIKEFMEKVLTHKQSKSDEQNIKEALEELERERKHH